ncbi:acyl-CoA synthetase [Bailinhaonella thermotolerans]|uniref:Acyl-CoA synthetase n=1 Tax=Bailinhaonella thermotolerans TaxID=1070861 RepID=A0A3A4BBK7_9ACTN|nr:acyl-CoA synthetase [Bailinhaonella thermotolerans]RJL35923.1 acyl-CoA synthetase [Bailinhaonella thermotolerans]
MQFNHADLFEGIADALGDRMALVTEDHHLTYAELDAHSNRLAHHLQAAGVRPGQHVGIQLFNGLEYVAGILAALKIRAVPINVNYRYVEDELLYLYRDADLVALLYDVEFDARVKAVAPQATDLRHLVSVGGASAVPGAVRYEDAVAAQSPRRDFPPRSGDDLYIIYTGGTTGMPKGAMWRLDDLFHAFWHPYAPPPKTPEELVEQARQIEPGVMMATPPLMHGAAQMATFISWWRGQTTVYVRKFDPARILRMIEREKVNTMVITGDAMARPLAEEIAGGDYDLSSLFVISSSASILSGTARRRLLEVHPNMLLLDNYGSSETGNTAAGVDGSTPESGLRFTPNDPNLTVLDDDFRPVAPGSGVMGQVAKSGRISLGYYNDPVKTAAKYREVDGVRWMLTGDLATVDADGRIALLGRGSECINTGGEKVFPEEVEAVLKGHPGVLDAVVTGIPDERMGSRVAAVVEPFHDRETPAESDLDAYCRTRLAGYKVPRLYVFVERMVRTPAGKADYPWARETAREAAGL